MAQRPRAQGLGLIRRERRQATTHPATRMRRDGHRMFRHLPQMWPSLRATACPRASGYNFADLEELAAAAKRIQGDILAARAYRPSPSAALSPEPRAWNGGAVAAQARRGNASATFAGEQVPRGWELSDRALYPYAYTLRTAHDSPVRGAPRQEREDDTRPGVRHATQQRSCDPPVRGDQRPGRRGFSGRCYQCGVTGHIARECRRTPVQEQTRGSGNGRGRR
ncbi:hypothetical protein HPB50_023180 [Hyalomma asiaticum]|uniref:Uncharacterized protein n=1 Tax=Hyalomma asiaticum TaxID=266040 RepID=A0ACB7TPP2_HYAAI|nr:hypothetical protein HPB50_023180 [Hyalomma asiaticum]